MDRRNRLLYIDLLLRVMLMFLWMLFRWWLNGTNLLLFEQSGLGLHLLLWLLLKGGGLGIHPYLLLLDNSLLRDHDRLCLLGCCLGNDVSELHGSGRGLGLLTEGHNGPR